MFGAKRVVAATEVGVPALFEPRQPRGMFIGQMQHRGETGQHAGVRLHARIVGAGRLARIDALVGVPEQRGLVASTQPRLGHIVEPRIERGAVGHHSVVHLVHARIQRRTAR